LDVDLALALSPENTAEIPGEHWVGVLVKSHDGIELATARLGFQLGPLDEDTDPLPFIPLPVGLRNVGVPSYGHYELEVTYDGILLASLRFVVEKLVPQGVTQQVAATLTS
jgi:hypothetical protein